jgi:hypothetical protein
MSLTAEWVNGCVSFSPMENSTSLTPHIMAIPRTLMSLRLYFQEWANMAPQLQAEIGRFFKRKDYDNLRTLYIAAKEPR